MSQVPLVPEVWDGDEPRVTKRVTIYYATGATKARIVLDAAQEIDWSYEETTVGDLQQIFERDAELIARMILVHLPAGTVDVLRGILVDKRKCRAVQADWMSPRSAARRLDDEEKLES